MSKTGASNYSCLYTIQLLFLMVSMALISKGQSAHAGPMPGRSKLSPFRGAFRSNDLDLLLGARMFWAWQFAFLENGRLRRPKSSLIRAFVINHVTRRLPMGKCTVPWHLR